MTSLLTQNRTAAHQRSARLRPALAIGLAWVLAGCTASVSGEEPQGEETAETRALISIDREQPGAVGPGSASALARFVSVASSTDPSATMRLVGIDLDLPATGNCTLRGGGSQPSLTSLGQVEFLEVGDVRVVAGGVATELAQRAFPTVTDAISGVVYTSRDQEAEPLPANVDYTLDISGSPALPAVEVSGHAPKDLRRVEVEGVPLPDVDELPSAEFDVSWNPGSAGDIVYVVLSRAEDALWCTFDDSAGFGALPGVAALPRSGSSTDETSPLRLEVHRSRTVPFHSEGLEGGELRFDFQVSSQALSSRDAAPDLPAN